LAREAAKPMARSKAVSEGAAPKPRHPEVPALSSRAEGPQSQHLLPNHLRSTSQAQVALPEHLLPRSIDAPLRPFHHGSWTPSPPSRPAAADASSTKCASKLTDAPTTAASFTKPAKPSSSTRTAAFFF